nr:hypothetical protein [Sphingosinicella sp. CPCC 101087]
MPGEVLADLGEDRIAFIPDPGDGTFVLADVGEVALLDYVGELGFGRGIEPGIAPQDREAGIEADLVDRVAGDSTRPFWFLDLFCGCGSLLRRLIGCTDRSGWYLRNGDLRGRWLRRLR